MAHISLTRKEDVLKYEVFLAMEMTNVIFRGVKPREVKDGGSACL
jgi:hypothetical protein